MEDELDNLTHTLTGLALSRAGLNRMTPRATLILLLAANAPDIDAVSGFGGALTYLRFHRHLTHALILLPVLPLLCVAVARIIGRRPLNWRSGYAVAMIGVALHVAMDLTNVYGVRLLLPFSGRWFRLDITHIVDVWIWAALLISVAAPALANLVSGEIGAAARSSYPARGFPIFALAFILLYDFGRAVAHARAVEMLNARIYSGAAPVRVAAFPGPLNPARWRGLVETRDSFIVFDFTLWSEFDPASGTVFYKPQPGPAIEAARRTEVFQQFLQFAQYPIWITTPAPEPENGTQVEAMDLRFGDPLNPGFVCTAVVNSRLHVAGSWFRFGAATPR